MFCPKCGSILIPKKNKTGKKVIACSCGYVDKEGTIELKESVKQEKEIEVVDNEDDERLPITEAECPKCGNKEAYYYTVQTRASDEPETKFLICTKCKNKWRDYS